MKIVFNGQQVDTEFTYWGNKFEFTAGFKLYVDGDLRDQCSRRSLKHREWCTVARASVLDESGTKRVVELQAMLVKGWWSWQAEERLLVNGQIMCQEKLNVGHEL